MISPSVKKRMQDPTYLELHFQAITALRETQRAPWYDSHFLRAYETAKRYLAEVRPDKRAEFIEAFAVLRPPPGFRAISVSDLIPDTARSQIAETVRSLPETSMEMHEMAGFGRKVVHDHAFFTALQEQVRPALEDRLNQDLVSGYNFLSLYGENGRCGLHLDQPVSMYTLDYCIDQDAEWPIMFSNIVDWPTSRSHSGNWKDAVFADPAIEFTEEVLHPGEALVFCGSSQWHYRAPMSDGTFCHLLFLHYHPKAGELLVNSRDWPRFFDIPELGPLCDVMNEAEPLLTSP